MVTGYKYILIIIKFLAHQTEIVLQICCKNLPQIHK